MNITRVLATDAKALSELATHCFVSAFAAQNSAANMDHYVKKSLSVDATTLELHDPSSTFLWATRSSEDAAVGSVTPLGYVKIRRGEKAPPCVTAARSVELQRLYVVPELVGGGLGHRLLRAAMETTHKEGFQTMWLGVWEHNKLASKFYERHGFVAVGSHDFLLGDDLQRDIIMQLSTVN
mmetsp:Transcript_25042/g.42327  ORF Transcript_25042/g.42327 Transcript_25042/m.42327 type:complete len:181 (+) Transcript_25042:65-607(+)